MRIPADPCRKPFKSLGLDQLLQKRMITWPGEEVIIDYQICMGCGICVQACPFSYP